MERCDLILQRAPARLDALEGPCARHGIRLASLRDGAVLLRAVPVQSAAELAGALLAHGGHVLLRPTGSEDTVASAGVGPHTADAVRPAVLSGEAFAPDPDLVGALPTPHFGQDLLSREDAVDPAPDPWALDPALIEAMDPAEIDLEHGLDGERLPAGKPPARPRIPAPAGPLELEPISGRFAALGRPPAAEEPARSAAGVGVGLAAHLLRDGPEVLHVVRPSTPRNNPRAHPVGSSTRRSEAGFGAALLGAPLLPLTAPAWRWHGRIGATSVLGAALWMVLHPVVGQSPLRTGLALAVLMGVAVCWVGFAARFFGACCTAAAKREGAPAAPPPLVSGLHGEVIRPGLGVSGFLLVTLGMPTWLAIRGLDNLTADVRTLWPAMVALPLLYLPIGLALSTADGSSRAIWNLPRGVFAALRAPLHVGVAWVFAGVACWGAGLAVLAVRNGAFPGAFADPPDAGTLVVAALAAWGAGWVVGLTGAVFGGIAAARPGIWDSDTEG